MGTLPLALRHSSSSGKRGGFFRSSRPGCPGQDAASSVCCLVIVSFTASQRLQAIAIRRLWLEMPTARMAPHEPHTRSGAEPLVPRIMIVSFLVAGRKTARFFRISFSVPGSTRIFWLATACPSFTSSCSSRRNSMTTDRSALSLPPFPSRASLST